MTNTIYNHKEIESKWQNYWDKNNTFHFEYDENRKTFYMLPMFLYPSGEMHLGHLRNFSISDVIARYKRLQGFNVLHPTGADAFGLPAENAAIKNHIHPTDWTYKNLDKIMKSMYSCGLSFDKERVFATCDPEYYGFQQKIFIDFYKNGLAFQKESFVNWDPVDQTVLANEQVIDGRGWRSGAIVQKKKLKQWFFKITNYAEKLLNSIHNGDLDGWSDKVKTMQENWIGKSEGATISFKITGFEEKLKNKNIIKLHCQQPFFDYIKTGIKNIEGRKNSEKYQKLKVGDIINFYSDDNDECYCEIIKIEKYKNLKDYLINNDLSNITPHIKTIDEAEKIYKSFSNDLDKYEFLGIHIKLLNDNVKVYTTRPDTIFGASFIGISFNHPIADELSKTNKSIKDFIESCKNTPVSEETLETAEKLGINTNLFVEHPFDKSIKLPIYIANFILMDYGTGAIFGCPAHDQRDYDFATKYNLPIKQVVAPKNNEKVELPYIEDGIAINSNFLSNLETKEAKKRIIEELEKLKIGKKKINYRLRDWGISRQRYWGCPIPMIHCPKCGLVPEKEENLPILLPKDVEFSGKGNPLANHPTWKKCKCPICNSDAERETDTMDTFVDSSWYFMRFIDLNKKKPINTDLCNKMLPIDQYVGGIEHATLHLMYARFFTKAFADIGYIDKTIKEPAKKLFNQGMVCHKAYKTKSGEWQYPWNVIEKDGKYYQKETNEELIFEGIVKMSKSKCNVVDINTILENYGSDSARMFVLSDTPADKDFEWTSQGISAISKYLNRIWKIITTFANENDINSFKNNKVTSINEMWKNNNKIIKDVGIFIDNLEFNKAIARLREFSNFFEKYTPTNENDKIIKYNCLVNFIKMLSVFCPHICEELNLILKQENTLDKSTWPTYDNSLTLDDEITITISVNGRTRANILVKKDITKDEMETIAKNTDTIKKYLDEKEIKKVIFVPNKLINFVL